MSAFAISYLLIWILVGLLLVFATVLLSALGATGGRITAAVPSTRTKLAVGRSISLPIVRDSRGREFAGRQSQWFFVSHNCPACDAVRDALSEALADDTDPVIVVVRGPAEAVAEWEAAVPETMHVVEDESNTLGRLFEIPRDPYFVRVSDRNECLAHDSVPVDLDARKSVLRLTTASEALMPESI